MKALITGISGSGASYLAEYLVSQQPDIEVHGISRWHSSSHLRNLETILDKITIHDCDLNDLSSVIRVLKKIKPDYIFHLAAHANVKVCFDNPIAVINNNINSTINLFEAIRLLELDPIIQFCGTSEVYGIVNKKDTPITESAALDPVNIYAISKLTQEKIARSYYLAYKHRVVITRMFAYINPRRNDIFSSAFAKKVVDIELGKSDILEHGNLDSIRTLIDVRDAMESYWVASNNCDYGVAYNIGGHDPVSVGQFLDILKEKATVYIPSKVDIRLLRPVDVTLQVPDVSKFTEKTKWIPKIPLAQSVEFLLHHYRKQSRN